MQVHKFFGVQGLGFQIRGLGISLLENQVMGAVVVLFVALSAVILRWNRLSPQRSSQELGREIELQSTRPF